MGGSYKGNSSNYHTLDIEGESYVFLSLDWCPSSDEVAWADGILGETRHARRS
jgi:hypothetical protein